MANTTTLHDKFLTITGLDADWTTPGDLPGFLPSGICVKSIRVHPSATGDIIIIKNGKGSHKTAAATIATTATAPEILRAKFSADTDQRVSYHNEGNRMFPFIDISDCTLSNAANARVTFELA